MNNFSLTIITAFYKRSIIIRKKNNIKDIPCATTLKKVPFPDDQSLLWIIIIIDSIRSCWETNVNGNRM